MSYNNIRTFGGFGVVIMSSRSSLIVIMSQVLFFSFCTVQSPLPFSILIIVPTVWFRFAREETFLRKTVTLLVNEHDAGVFIIPKERESM